MARIGKIRPSHWLCLQITGYIPSILPTDTIIIVPIIIEAAIELLVCYAYDS